MDDKQASVPALLLDFPEFTDMSDAELSETISAELKITAVRCVCPRCSTTIAIPGATLAKAAENQEKRFA